MTIDEAIAQERENARRNRILADSDELVQNSYDANFNIKKCVLCAEKHEYLAEWLEELKELREIKAGHLYATAFNRGYTKALSEHHKLDSLISECRRAMFDESDGQVLSDIHQGVNSGLSMAIHFAEQLKE